MDTFGALIQELLDKRTRILGEKRMGLIANAVRTFSMVN